ncbi:DHA1 family inner membrane transport protein [Kushneria sinocarnis]|uniref:DHA1 family inner membrane transport protein n=1 Tax=Kushneria sinocarnis TaxID=595502 RepID=A0A420WZF1_9GAMM|nr:MFS transporter [Kushneria sinocarnis]RKR06713.1 DHA1 family inner membrane transport protein [Kushneria sinocarnis]
MSDPQPVSGRFRTLALLALAVGSFVISTSEFASMGLLPLFAEDLQLSVPQATYGITAYALGVVVGAPVITIMAAGVDKRGLLIALMALAFGANLLTAIANDLDLLVLGRFLSGLPQGAYFGAASVVAGYIVGQGREGSAVALVMSGITISTIIGAPISTQLGQLFSWRMAYGIIGICGLGSAVLLWCCVPSTRALRGGTVRRELSALRRGSVWVMMLATALAIASVFSIYTFVDLFVTRVAGMSSSVTPYALALIGIGLAIGNVIGGFVADRYPFRGIFSSWAAVLVVLAVMATFAHNPVVLMVFFAVMGITMQISIPSIPVRMMKMAPEAPTLMGALNMAAFNVANALGAAIGGQAIGAGFGPLSPIWTGFIMTAAGLMVAGLLYRHLKKTGNARAFQL